MEVTDVFMKIDKAVNRYLTKEEASARNKVNGIDDDDEFAAKEGDHYYRLIVNKGGSRSSKTYSLMQYFAKTLMEQKKKITVWRAEKTNCRATVMDDFNDIINSDIEIMDEFIQNKTKGSYKNKETDGIIIFEGTDSPAKVHGLKQDWSLFNEATEISEAVYLQIQQRTGEIIFVDYNPSKEFFIEGMFGREDVFVIHSTYLDNAFCPADIVRTLNSYNPFHPDDEHLPRSQRRPHPINVKYGTANEYMYDVYCLGLNSEKPGKIFNGWNRISVKDFEDLPYEKVFGLDFGLIVPTALIEIKFDGDNTIYVRESLYKEMNMMAYELWEEIGRSTNFNKRKDLIIADPNNKDEINKLLAHDFEVYRAKKPPGSVVSTIKTIMSLNVVVCEDSRNIWDEYMNYTWRFTPKGEQLEEPLKKDDHAMDALRYGATYIVTANRS